MKLFGALALATFSNAWEQPAWKDVQATFGDGRLDFDWGAPVEGNGRKWDDCPALNASAIAGKYL